MSTEPTVFVVDDDSDVRDSLKGLFKTANFQVGTYSTVQEFLNRFDPNRPGCLLLDVRMPGLDGLELQQHLAASKKRFSTIIVTTYANRVLAAATMKAITVDLIEKPFDTKFLLVRLREAIERDLAECKLLAERHEISKLLASLTDQEQQIMDLMVEGKPTKLIAAQLGTNVNTASNRRSSILKKLQVESAVALTRMITIFLNNLNKAVSKHVVRPCRQSENHILGCAPRLDS